jgi:hypothetical protein
LDVLSRDMEIILKKNQIKLQNMKITMSEMKIHQMGDDRVAQLVECL